MARIRRSCRAPGSSIRSRRGSCSRTGRSWKVSRGCGRCGRRTIRSWCGGPGAGCSGRAGRRPGERSALARYRASGADGPGRCFGGECPARAALHDIRPRVTSPRPAGRSECVSAGLRDIAGSRRGRGAAARLRSMIWSPVSKAAASPVCREHVEPGPSCDAIRNVAHGQYAIAGVRDGRTSSRSTRGEWTTRAEVDRTAWSEADHQTATGCVSGARTPRQGASRAFRMSHRSRAAAPANRRGSCYVTCEPREP